MGSMSRRKGKVGERECAAEFSELLGVQARRGVQFQGGPESPDVVLPGTSLHVECKRVERLKLWDAIDQANADAPRGAVPLVWHRCNRRKSVVIVETERLVDLAIEILRARNAS